MIQMTIYRNRNKQYIGFDCMGHAGFAKAGEDIVCAGVSALVLNTVKSIACYTEEPFSADPDEEIGKVCIRFHAPAGHDAELLMKSLTLGLTGIREQYGAKYMTLNFKEV